MVPRSAVAQGDAAEDRYANHAFSRGTGTPIMRDLARLMSGRPRHALPLAALLLLLLLAAPAARAGAGDPTNPFAGQRLFLNCEDLGSNGQAWNPWWRVAPRQGPQPRSLLAHRPRARWSSRSPARRRRRSAGAWSATWPTSTTRRSAGSTAPMHQPTRPRPGPPGPSRRDRRDPLRGRVPDLAIRSMNYSACKGRGRRPTTPYKLPSTASWPSSGARSTPTSPIATAIPRRPGHALALLPRAPRGGHPRARPARPDRPGDLPVPAEKLSRSAHALGGQRLTSLPDVAVYIDAGEDSWLPRRQALRLLRRAGVGRARGFALNSTHTAHDAGQPPLRQLDRQAPAQALRGQHGRERARQAPEAHLEPPQPAHPGARPPEHQLQPAERRPRAAADAAHGEPVGRRLPVDLPSRASPRTRATAAAGGRPRTCGGCPTR